MFGLIFRSIHMLLRSFLIHPSSEAQIFFFVKLNTLNVCDKYMVLQMNTLNVYDKVINNEIFYHKEFYTCGFFNSWKSGIANFPPISGQHEWCFPSRCKFCIWRIGTIQHHRAGFPCKYIVFCSFSGSILLTIIVIKN